MSTLIFDGKTHQITLTDRQGRVVGTWTAYNNVDPHATLRHVPNGTYSVQDRTAPHRHVANANGPYGLYGVIRFDVPHHSGIAVHSGRANAGGPAHPTMGCIRTTDAAMQSIRDFMRGDQLSTIQINGNSAAIAANATHRHRSRKLSNRNNVR